MQKEKNMAKKELKDLNLLDRFLFAEAMEDAEIMETVVRIILNDDIIIKEKPQTESEKRRNTLSKYVKLDVWAVDTDNNVYDTEVQKKNTKNLPKRSRFYQGIIDSGLLESGETDYNKLNNIYIIVISPFDLFGEDEYMYTFKMKCEECDGLELGDGATRIFLNTRGKKDENVSRELVELLHYIEKTTDEMDSSCQSDLIHKMHRKIKNIKSSAEVGERYMHQWEEREYDREEGREEGREEEREALIRGAIKNGLTDEQLVSILANSLDEESAKEYVADLRTKISEDK